MTAGETLAFITGAWAMFVVLYIIGLVLDVGLVFRRKIKIVIHKQEEKL